MHKVIYSNLPQYLRQLVHNGARSDHSSRNSILVLPKTRINIYKMSFVYSGSFCWNALPRSLKQHAQLTHVQLAHSNLKLFNIFALNVTQKFSILNSTVFSFLMFYTPAILCVYI